MTLIELTEMVHAADRRQSGCAVTFTTRNAPETHRGSMYGYVLWGMDESKRVFHDERELREILERLGKR